MEDTIRVLRTDEIQKVWFGRPSGHRHHRLAMQLADGTVLIFPEAVVAAIVRAYTGVKNHPTRRAVELQATEAVNRKKDFARHQLLETDRSEQEIAALLADLLSAAEMSRSESA